MPGPPDSPLAVHYSCSFGPWGTNAVEVQLVEVRSHHDCLWLEPGPLVVAARTG